MLLPVMWILICRMGDLLDLDPHAIFVSPLVVILIVNSVNGNFLILLFLSPCINQNQIQSKLREP